MASQPLRVGNGAGFWGDNLDAPFLLARDGRLDVLTLEYLAELTLAILGHLRSKDPAAGYVTDFPDLLERLVADPPRAGGPEDRDQRRGPEPARVRPAVRGDPRPRRGTGTRSLGRGDRRRRPRPDPGMDPRRESTSTTWRPASRSRPWPTGWSAPTPTSAPGRSPRRSAPAARVVITGRVADASLTLGPACAHFGWAWDDWDRLAGALGRRPPHRVRRPGDRRPLAPLGRGPRPRRRSATRSPRSTPTARP